MEFQFGVEKVILVPIPKYYLGTLFIQFHIFLFILSTKKIKIVGFPRNCFLKLR